MRALFAIWLVLRLLHSGPASAEARRVEVAATADTWIGAGYYDQALHAETSVLTLERRPTDGDQPCAGNAPVRWGPRRALVRFALAPIPADASDLRATLRARLAACTHSGTLEAFALEAPWDARAGWCEASPGIPWQIGRAHV